MVEEKLYRVKTKEGAHINEKRKDDGSRVAIQFDDKNGLQGPVDLIEVDESEYTREVYVEVERQTRSFGQVILKEVVIPALTDTMTVFIIRSSEAGINAIRNFMSQKVIPAVKAKGVELINIAFESQEAKKKAQREDKIITQAIKKQESKIASISVKQGNGTVVHTREEVGQFLNNIKFAALYIAANIRELSSTVIADDGSDPEKRLAMETKLRELSSEDVMNTIESMLEDGNRVLLDQATIQLFEAFRHKEFIVEGEAVPISRYLTAVSEE